MSIKEKYIISSIDSYLTNEWLLKKHYAKRLCPLSYTFGLHDKNNILIGICGFGSLPSPTLVEALFQGKYTDIIIELKRLVVNDGLEKNVLSYFVSECLKLLPKPMAIVSFADPNNGHHGYIYQATNWIYTGIGSATPNFFLDSGKQVHSRGVHEYKNKGENITVEEQDPKHRYLYFLADKRTKKNMLKLLKYRIKPYPKGDNTRYDSSYKPLIQTNLF